MPLTVRALFTSMVVIGFTAGFTVTNYFDWTFWPSVWAGTTAAFVALVLYVFALALAERAKSQVKSTFGRS